MFRKIVKFKCTCTGALYSSITYGRGILIKKEVIICALKKGIMNKNFVIGTFGFFNICLKMDRLQGTKMAGQTTLVQDYR